MIEEAEVVVEAMVLAWIWKFNKTPFSVLEWAQMLLNNLWPSTLVALVLSRYGTDSVLAELN